MIIDKIGNVSKLPDGICIEEGELSEGLVPVRNLATNKCGYVNKNGNLVIDYKYQEAKNFYEGLALVSYDGRGFGFIDKRGEIVVPFIYGEFTSNFKNGIARVCDSRYNIRSDYKLAKYANVGVINKKGEKLVSPGDYEKLGWFDDGMACVLKNGKMGFINVRGELVIPCIYDEYSHLYDVPFMSGLARVEKNGKVGFVDKQGNSTFDKIQ